MDRIRSHIRRAAWILILATLVGFGVWAAKELSGQVNSMSQKAGANSLDYEIAALDSMESVESQQKKPQPPPCDWLKLRDLRHEIEANNQSYEAAVQKVQRELESQGGVTRKTRKDVLDLAQEYKKANEQKADLYNACNCGTRARTHRELAVTRMASAQVLVADEIDTDNLKKLESSQNDVAEAHTAYADSVESSEVSTEDKLRLRNSVLPQIDRDLQGFTQFIQNVATLFEEVNATVDDVSEAANTRNPLQLLDRVRTARDSGLGLLNRVRALLALAKGSEKNLKTIQANAQRLAQ